MRQGIGILFLLLILSCGKDRQASRGVWDETENGVAVLVLDENGAPVKGAKVRMIPIREWSEKISLGNTPVSDSGTASENGRVHLKNTAWPVAVEVELGNLVGWILLDQEQDSQIVVLENGQELTGQLKVRQGVFPSFVRIAGSTSKATVTKEGQFRFPLLPSGNFLLVVEEAQQLSALRSVTMEGTGNQNLDSVPILSQTEILLDDFSDHIPANQFYFMTGRGWWYNFADTGSTVTPEDPLDALEDGALHVRFLPDTTRVEAFTMTGFDLEGSVLDEDLSKASHDLADMDSLCFQARGSGQIMVQAVGLDSLGNKDHTNANIQLDTAWQIFCLDPSEFEDWGKVGSRLAGFAFASQSNAELWLDQIVLYGLTQRELFPHL